MRKYRGFAVAAALAFAVGCGNGAERGADGAHGSGGADGFGDNKSPTPAERTGATGDSGRGMTGAMSLSDDERRFVQKASMSHQMEVALGNLAEDKAENDRVKQLGEQLARDHEAANRELQTGLGGGDATTAQQPGGGTSVPPASRTAAGHGATPSGDAAHAGEQTQMQQQMAQVQQRLERVTGREFDRTYLDEMAKHHQQDIQEFERAAQSDNAQIRAYAERMLPVLRGHLTQIQQLQGQQQP